MSNIKIELFLETEKPFTAEQGDALATLVKSFSGGQASKDLGTIKIDTSEVEKVLADAAKVEEIPSTGTQATTEDKPKRTRTSAKDKEAANKAAETAKEEVPADTETDTNEVEKADSAGSDSTSGATISLDDIRALVSLKSGTHREAIKAKCTEYGAKNIVTIPEDKYQEFYDFLNGLS